MDFLISGKAELVLGASRGLGAAIAQGLAAEGVKVFACARNVAAMEKTDSIIPLAVDLSDEASVAAMNAAVRTDGGVDILVNNSGGPTAVPAAGQSKANWMGAFESITSIFTVTGVGLVEDAGRRSRPPRQYVT